MQLSAIVLAAVCSLISSIVLSRLGFLISRDLFDILPAPSGSIMANKDKGSYEYARKIQRRSDEGSSASAQFLFSFISAAVSFMLFFVYVEEHFSRVLLFATGPLGALAVFASSVTLTLLIFGLVWLLYAINKIYRFDLRELRFIDQFYDRLKASCRAKFAKRVVTVD